MFALLGPNGAGKSTTLRVMRRAAPSSGGICVRGRSTQRATADALARSGLCLIPEGRGVFPNLTVLEEPAHGDVTGRLPCSDVVDLASRQFPRLGERRKQPAGTLSGGEQQMLAMARALATEPAVLLIDELSMGLAPISSRSSTSTFAGSRSRGVDLIVEQFARTRSSTSRPPPSSHHGAVRA